MCHETLYQMQSSSLWPHIQYSEVVEACLDVCCELEEGRCSRVSRSEAVLILGGERNSLIYGKMSASRTLAAVHSSEIGL